MIKSKRMRREGYVARMRKRRNTRGIGEKARRKETTRKTKEYIGG
jgi:hypothetical protein